MACDDEGPGGAEVPLPRSVPHRAGWPPYRFERSGPGCGRDGDRPANRPDGRSRPRASDPGGTRSGDLYGFWVDVVGAHPIHREAGTGAYVCRCGLTATYCPVHRAAIRNRLSSADEIPWQPLPEDLP